jgi:DNA polymerase-3 subunit alpha
VSAGPEPLASEGPALPEWEPAQLLEGEKEVLGFYVSGHPLARYRALVESLGVTATAELPGRGAGARVLLFGHALALKEIPTRGGDRMAFVTLEDMEGTVELTVFPASFRAAAPLLRSRDPILVRGRIDDTDKGRVVLVEEVRPLASLVDPPGGRAAGEPTVQVCRIIVRGDHADAPAQLAAIARLAAAHAGPVPMLVHVLLPEHEVVVRARRHAVDGSAELVAKLQEHLGPTAIMLDHDRRA